MGGDPFVVAATDVAVATTAKLPFPLPLPLPLPVDFAKVGFVASFLPFFSPIHRPTRLGGLGVSSGTSQSSSQFHALKNTFLAATLILAWPSVNVGTPIIASYPANPAT